MRVRLSLQLDFFFFNIRTKFMFIAFMLFKLRLMSHSVIVVVVLHPYNLFLPVMCHSEMNDTKTLNKWLITILILIWMEYLFICLLCHPQISNSRLQKMLKSAFKLNQIHLHIFDYSVNLFYFYFQPSLCRAAEVIAEIGVCVCARV